jgi:hypothetical protein
MQDGTQRTLKAKLMNLRRDMAVDRIIGSVM